MKHLLKKLLLTNHNRDNITEYDTNKNKFTL